MSDPLKVCLLNDSFPPQIDGVANAVFNYATYIQKNHGTATVAAPRYPNVSDDYPFRVVRYTSVDVTKFIGYRAGNPFSIKALDALSSTGPDIIHSHCPLVSTMMARPLRHITDAPLILTYHTKFDIDFARIVKSKELVRQAVKIMVDNVTSCDEVWVVSRGAGENLRSLGYQGDYLVMDNGVDVPRGEVEPALVEDVRREYGLDPLVPTFLFVGRLAWYKGLRIILDAARQLTDKGISYRVVIVGGGFDTEEIREYAAGLGLTEKECLFTGPILDRERLRGLYGASDLFLFPSTFDTNGIVVREAAACGLGSILVRGSCAAEGVEEDRCCLLIDENADSMAVAMENACSHRDRMRRIGQNAMNEIYLSWEDSVARAAERYHVVLENKKAGKYPKKKAASDFFYDSPGVIVEWTQRFEAIQRRLSDLSIDDEFM